MTNKEQVKAQQLAALPPEVQGIIASVLGSVLQQIIAAVIAAWHHPAPLPPSPPAPLPVDPPAPPPPPPAPPVSEVPKPMGIKLGRRDAVKRELGYRNMLNVTPLDVNGVPIPEGFGAALQETYGQPLAEQSINGGPWEPVERASGDSFGCILTIVTNEPSEWDGGIYRLTGQYRIRVSYPHFTFWRQQTGTMLSSGLLVGIGTDSAAENTEKAVS